MVRGKEDEGQIDRSRADLHQNGVREIAGGGLGICFARDGRRELECGGNGRACG